MAVGEVSAQEPSRDGTETGVICRAAYLVLPDGLEDDGAVKGWTAYLEYPLRLPSCCNKWQRRMWGIGGEVEATRGTWIPSKYAKRIRQAWSRSDIILEKQFT